MQKLIEKRLKGLSAHFLGSSWNIQGSQYCFIFFSYQIIYLFPIVFAVKSALSNQLSFLDIFALSSGFICFIISFCFLLISFQHFLFLFQVIARWSSHTFVNTAGDKEGDGFGRYVYTSHGRLF